MRSASSTASTTLATRTLLLCGPASCYCGPWASADLDPEHLLEVFGEQRLWFVAIMEGFGPGDWAAPTRCADWSARHLAAAGAWLP